MSAVGTGTTTLAGRYVFVDLLGSGGMGSVWRVWDLREGRYRAAKLLRQQRADLLLRFVAEQGTRISHPHVLAPQAWAAEDDRVAFLMELVDGGSVADLLGDHGALPAAVTVELVDQVLQGLVAVHEAGVVHRDVKPANLLLRATGRGRPHLLVSDFGISVRADLPRLTSADERLLTVGYAAPELDRGDDPHPSADVYSVGVVALELASGRRPGPTDDDVAGRLRSIAPASLAPGLREVVASMTGPAPSARPDARRALQAGRTAAAGVTLPTPVDAAGEPFEVLAQLPALPEGWTRGPVGGTPTRTGSGTRAGDDVGSGSDRSGLVDRSTGADRATRATRPDRPDRDRPDRDRPEGPDPRTGGVPGWLPPAVTAVATSLAAVLVAIVLVVTGVLG